MTRSTDRTTGSIRMREQVAPDGSIGAVVQGVALLRECYFYRDLQTEAQQVALWRAFEDVLTQRAPIREFFTPGWDPQFEADSYEAMLRNLGYTPVKVKVTRFWKKLAGQYQWKGR